MRLLVLGAQGFIGRNLVKFFLDNRNEVVGFDLVEYSEANYPYYKISILSSDFESLISNYKFDVCINASGSGNVSYSMTHPLSDFEANTRTVMKVLDTIRKNQPACKYVHISSAAIYGNPAHLPIDESVMPCPLSPYGYHKWMSEIVCREYSELFSLPIAIIRPFSVYGPGLKKQLLWDISHKFQDGDLITMFGTGDETRDFIHIDDLLSLIDIIVKSSPFKCDIYNAASGIETSIREVAYIFSSYFNNSKKVVFSGTKREGDPINWRANVSKVDGLGFTYKVQLSTGIFDYIKWFQSIKSSS